MPNAFQNNPLPIKFTPIPTIIAYPFTPRSSLTLLSWCTCLSWHFTTTGTFKLQCLRYGLVGEASPTSHLPRTFSDENE